jgi:lincosamide nucleotidyltransferase A/C/D/E
VLAPPPTEMTADDVLGFLALMQAQGVRVWLDGGWAVDACLGAQTRRHADLDIVVEEGDVAAATAALRARGYAPVPRDDTRAWNFVLGDDAGHQVDFHVIVLDAQGHGIYGPREHGNRYPAEALAGTGTVNGRPVACVAPEWLVRFHTGYDVDATDWADVSALCARFGIPIPEAYARFR